MTSRKSELPVRWIGDSWKGKVEDVRFTSALSIDGAVASWCEKLTQLILGQTHLSMEEE